MKKVNIQRLFYFEKNKYKKNVKILLYFRIINNEAERIIEMQKYFLIKTDSFLGTTNINNIKFYVRRVMPDLKVNLKKLDKKSDFIDFVNDVALVVAKAHSRAKKNINIINDLNKIRNNIIDFSKNYVKQVKFDYEIFKQS